MLYQPIVNIFPEGFNKFTVPKEVNQSFRVFFTKDAGESDLPLPLLAASYPDVSLLMKIKTKRLRRRLRY